MVGWRCPKCGSADLDVRVSVWARLDQTFGALGADPKENEFSTLVDEGRCSDHEWDEGSPMSCRTCPYEGVAGDFALSSPPDGALAVAGRGIPEKE